MLTVKLNRHAFKLALSRKNLTQREAARMIRFSRSHLSHVVTGRREPSPAMRRAILEQFREYGFDVLFIIEDGADGDKR